MLSQLLAISFVASSYATTEWWGDLRAHLNPPRNPAFYDVTYDETVALSCPQGLRADAIPEYVYFGTMLATMTVDEHDECLKKCSEKPRCKSVNYFHPFAYQEKGFCELLTESQINNPALMRPFRKATYYEKIRCREPNDHEDISSAGSAAHNKAEISIKKPDLSSFVKKISLKIGEFNGGFRRARR
ncbi:hypothetical protein WR25_02752 [Diploscapter pachys]|uniref:Apple domain-containing protein n=1 Tax=Diploscapter pachys TaxID=2018661 RepID=A0A2A2LSI3_9BILA|nr:hypothetical protein WR25_02752 [Diploscapter pachys]